MTDSLNPDGDSRRVEVEAKIAQALRSLLDGGTPWSDITVDAIAKEAGIKRTLFYVYFTDKSAVLIRLGNELIEETVRGIESHWLVEADGPESLRKEMDSFWATQAGSTYVIRALMEGATVDPHLRAYWKSLSRSFVNPTQRRIEEARKAGHHVSDADPAMLALCLVLMTEKVTLEGLLDDSHDRDALSDAAFELWKLALYGAENSATAPEVPSTEM